MCNETKNSWGSEFIDYISGGNHELFHSNVLAYIAKNYPDFFLAILPDDCKETLKNHKNQYEVVREEKHLDVAIKRKEPREGENEYILVIENKMKSLPDMEQLDRYSQNIKADAYILLTLFETDEDALAEKGWKQISYQQLAERMNNCRADKNFNGYFGNFLNDYTGYIQDFAREIEPLKAEIKTNPKVSEFLVALPYHGRPSWREIFQVKARYHLLAEEILKNVDMPVYCRAGIVRGRTPFIDIWPYNNEQRKTRKKKYWIQIYRDHVEHGVLVYYDEIAGTENKKPEKSRKKDARADFLGEIWESCKKDKELRFFVNSISEIEGININDLYGYIYDEYVMVDARTPIPADIHINEFVRQISHEIKMILAYHANENEKIS